MALKNEQEEDTITSGEFVINNKLA
ncbi:uncharacterized protein G2W53_030710 [Senna tora]|uniref:Uncharacterized protein n=1 Tax=Senna tora TaxID=362788 RepID=A0A834WEU4_9FABA|nr:uncharacterized protein G2W53_030710 [Senna tora]